MTVHHNNRFGLHTYFLSSDDKMVMIVSITLTFLSYSQTKRERERERERERKQKVSLNWSAVISKSLENSPQAH